MLVQYGGSTAPVLLGRWRIFRRLIFSIGSIMCLDQLHTTFKVCFSTVTCASAVDVAGIFKHDWLLLSQIVLWCFQWFHVLLDTSCCYYSYVYLVYVSSVQAVELQVITLHHKEIGISVSAFCLGKGKCSFRLCVNLCSSSRSCYFQS